MAWSSEQVKDIRSRNPSTESKLFILPSRYGKNRPFPIISMTIMGPSAAAPYDNSERRSNNFSMLEVTPLYIGQFKNIEVQHYHSGLLTSTQQIGGAVELFALFDRVHPGIKHEDFPKLKESQSTGIIDIYSNYSLTAVDLSYVAGASSYAPGALLAALHPKILSSDLDLHAHYWSPAAGMIMDHVKTSSFAVD